MRDGRPGLSIDTSPARTSLGGVAKSGESHDNSARAQALVWTRRAAEQGDVSAQMDLARLLQVDIFKSLCVVQCGAVWCSVLQRRACSVLQ